MQTDIIVPEAVPITGIPDTSTVSGPPASLISKIIPSHERSTFISAAPPKDEPVSGAAVAVLRPVSYVASTLHSPLSSIDLHL